VIVDVPTPGEFHTAGVNQLYLAWKIAIGTQQAVGMASDDDEEGIEAYWRSVQPELANAYSLIQQAMEMALKGRIAAVSPFLLLSRDPREWPKGVDTRDTSFGEFHTLNASDLLKVHNSVVKPALDNEFGAFWDTVRRDRNRIMHSTSRATFTASQIVLAILRAAQSLFADMSWPTRLLAQEAGQKYAIFSMDDHVYSSVVGEIACAMDLLTPADARAIFGFDKGRRAYVCPQCYVSAERDFAVNLPKLAQFSSRRSEETTLHCVFCDVKSEVERLHCEYPDCRGNVIDRNLCLTCLREQDEQFSLTPAFLIRAPDDLHDYEFVVGRESGGRRDEYRSHRQRAADDEDAIAYGRRMLDAAHLQVWQTVSIFQREGCSVLLEPETCRPIGHWAREDGGLLWYPSVLAYNSAAHGPV
jgi:hypothetical protein